MKIAITGTVDDNAGLVGYDITSRSQYADFTANKGGFLDLTINVPRTGAATATFNRTGGVVSQEIQENADRAQSTDDEPRLVQARRRRKDGMGVGRAWN